jgi:tetratricopeptide (TPR) repeat protein
MAGPSGDGTEANRGRFGRNLSQILDETRKSERMGVVIDHVRWLVGEDGYPWISELARVAKSERLTPAELRDATSELSWMSREAGEPIPGNDLAVASEDVDKETFALTLAYVRGQRLRYDFRFREILHCVEDWRREHDDALFCALAAFAACGLRLPDGLTLYKKSIQCDDADKVSRHVSLTAIWMAQHVPEQAILLLELADEMITHGEADAVLYFRRARAYARLRDYERALDDIYRAMDLVGPDQNLVHADYVRDWQLIVTRIDLEEWAKKLTDEIMENIQEEAAARLQEIEKTLSDGQLRMVEILGLFMALVGFLVAGGTTFALVQTWAQAITTVVLIGAGFIGFFVMLRWVIHYKRKR